MNAIIGASLSEPHINGKTLRELVCVCMVQPSLSVYGRLGFDCKILMIVNCKIFWSSQSMVLHCTNAIYIYMCVCIICDTMVTFCIYVLI